MILLYNRYINCIVHKPYVQNEQTDMLSFPQITRYEMLFLLIMMHFWGKQEKIEFTMPISSVVIFKRKSFLHTRVHSQFILRCLIQHLIVNLALERVQLDRFLQMPVFNSNARHGRNFEDGVFFSNLDWTMYFSWIGWAAIFSVSG